MAKVFSLRVLLSCALLSALLPGMSAADDPECRQTSREHFVSGWETADSVRIIHTRLTPDGAVFCTFYPHHSEKLNVRVAYEAGVFDGVEYRIFYSDGSGIIQGQSDVSLADSDVRNHWALTCRKNNSAAPTCTVSRANLQVTRLPGGDSKLTLGGDWATDSDILMRIDKHWAMEAQAATGFSNQQVMLILNQMVSGRSVDTRFHAAEKRHPTYKTLSLFGFKQALEIADQIIMQALPKTENPT